MSNTAGSQNMPFAPWADLNDKTILISGGTGSFGQHFVRTVLNHAQPRRLVIFSRDELKQVEMESDLSRHPRSDVLRFFLGDVRDQDRLDMALRGIDYVVHAAALKHVTKAEYDPFECIRTNVIGAENIVRASIRAGVKRVIALSTDKAANPANLYGASKLAADKIFVAANSLAGHDGTRFAVVRYGNVIGSRGSVVPFFRRLLAQGAESLPITHPDMTRFWITLDQGVGLVNSSLEAMQGGEIFVPKIPSMKITELARAIAPNVPLNVVGIRPGEKLHEVLVTEDEGRSAVETEDRIIINPAFSFWAGNKNKIEGATNVPDGFRYASDTNTEWLNEISLLALLDDSKNAH